MVKPEKVVHPATSRLLQKSTPISKQLSYPCLVNKISDWVSKPAAVICVNQIHEVLVGNHVSTWPQLVVLRYMLQ